MSEAAKKGSFRYNKGGRRSSRFHQDNESRGSTPDKKRVAGAPLPYQPPMRDKGFDPKEYMVAESTQREIEVYKQIFDYFDTDDDGMLTPMDLRRAMIQYGNYHCKRNFVYQIIAIHDADLSGQINFKEFVKMMTLRPCENDKNQDIERVFNQIDENQKGYISENDLMNLADELNEEITLEEIRALMKKCDPSGEGKRISSEAFLAFNKQKKF